MYWGKYVQHDNNRDGMGQYLKITQNFTKGVLEWHPTVLHDLHEAQSLSLRLDGHRAVQRLARPDRRSTSGGCWRRPKSWRWPSAAFPASSPTASTTAGCRTTSSGSRITHNSFGRFYEVQSYGPDVNPNLHARRHADQPRMVPAESAAALHRLGTAQQHQHPGIRAAARA